MSFQLGPVKDPHECHNLGLLVCVSHWDDRCHSLTARCVVLMLRLVRARTSHTARQHIWQRPTRLEVVNRGNNRGSACADPCLLTERKSLSTLTLRWRRGPGERPGPWSILWSACGASEPAETDSRPRSPRRIWPALGTARPGCWIPGQSGDKQTHAAEWRRDSYHKMSPLIKSPHLSLFVTLQAPPLHLCVMKWVVVVVF